MSNKTTRVLIIGINYYPEDSAIGLYTTQMAEFLVSNGHDVSIITGFPYYPQWKIADEYKNKSLFMKETINGVKVFRCKQYVPSKPTFSKRLIHILSFTIGNFINLFRLSKHDIVISVIPFTTSAFLGALLKLRYKSKLWIHIQDFEFDAAFDSGILSPKSSILLRFLMKVEKKILDKADVVSTISYGMINRLKEKTSTKSLYLPNWIDASLFAREDSSEKHRYLRSDAFKILYSGNIGSKQDWVLFLHFVEAIKQHEGIEIIIVGEGAEKEKLLKSIKDYKFIKHYNLVPYEELPLLLSSADLHILFQKNSVIDTVMPSKLLGMMASKKPSIVTGNIHSEVAKIFSKREIGYFFDDQSVSRILESTLLLKKDHNLRLKMGHNAKEFVQEKYSKDEVLNNFLNQLSNI